MRRRWLRKCLTWRCHPRVITFPSSDPDAQPVMAAAPVTGHLPGPSEHQRALVADRAGWRRPNFRAVQGRYFQCHAGSRPRRRHSRTERSARPSPSESHREPATCQSGHHGLDHVSTGEFMDLQHRHVHADRPVHAERALIGVLAAVMLWASPRPRRFQWRCRRSASSWQPARAARRRRGSRSSTRGKEPVRVRATVTDWDLSRRCAAVRGAVPEVAPTPHRPGSASRLLNR